MCSPMTTENAAREYVKRRVGAAVAKAKKAVAAYVDNKGGFLTSNQVTLLRSIQDDIDRIEKTLRTF
jgi:hypothetical protein